MPEISGISARDNVVFPEGVSTNEFSLDCSYGVHREPWSDLVFEFGCGTIESGISKLAAVFCLTCLQLLVCVSMVIR